MFALVTGTDSPEKVREALAAGQQATIVGKTADVRDFAGKIETAQEQQARFKAEREAAAARRAEEAGKAAAAKIVADRDEVRERQAEAQHAKAPTKERGAIDL
ncbi:hypothetical protein [Burkholderia ubonensis]|uniref:Uncharacterized protein n=1 Tax=Burkholderia ubonensis TaxID=101571 RepID=A0ABD6Q0S9_9BURK|nr:hypothetical protein [Burkholderia ubonensis]OJA44814.1 hypothetical protein BGV66_20235 [Burkholderia ubonensis]